MPSVGDAARYLFWVQLRELADPRDTSFLRMLSRGISRGQYALSARRRDLLLDELRRTFPEVARSDRTLQNVCRSSYDLHVQCLVEELLLGQLVPENIDVFMTFDGREHLDAALALGRGVVLVYPHAGAVMLMIARLTLSGLPYTQVAARGFPPPEKQISAEQRPSWLNRRVREARESAEDALGARYHGFDDSPRALYRDLASNHIVGIAFDGRGSTAFDRVSYLGRPSLLSPGPWKLAAATGAAVVPAMCIRQRNRSHRLRLAPPIIPREGPRREVAAELRETALQQHLEPWLRQHPDHYGRWLLHTRLRAPLDDAPLFETVTSPRTGG